MVTTITEVLNIWNDLGVFSYVIPFLLIFAVVFAILKKTKILGDKSTGGNDGILAIIAAALGLLSLQFDYVSEFFAVIFPRFGIGLSLFLVAIILIGFFAPSAIDPKKNHPLGIIGWITGIGVIIWALSDWDEWNDVGGFGGWFSDNIWALLVLGGVIAIIVLVTKSDKGNSPAGG